MTLKLKKLKNASAHVASDIKIANATVADITSLIKRATITTLGPITGTNPRNQRRGIPKTETCSYGHALILIPVYGGCKD